MSRRVEERTVKVTVVRCDLCGSELRPCAVGDVVRTRIAFIPAASHTGQRVELLRADDRGVAIVDEGGTYPVDLCAPCSGELAGFLQSRADHHRGDITV